MNVLSLADLKEQVLHQIRLGLRVLDPQRSATTFSTGGESHSIQRIYVINLDRSSRRWRQVRRELDRFKDRHGRRLSALTRRFSAVDARFLAALPDPAVLTPTFTLADHLTVDPNTKLPIDDTARSLEIAMTKPEIAVALSHIEIWKLIARGDVESALVLEDDVFFAFGFARRLESTWRAVTSDHVGASSLDLLYLSFKEVGDIPARSGRDPVRRTAPGIWQASGYVLTRDGARKLLDQLPVCGPIDLWLNLQFDNLSVYTASESIIEQRIGEPSTNSYSILPILSQLGVITREKPLVHSTQRLVDPVVAVGEKGSGLTPLATALSMLGYTCASDVTDLPNDEVSKLVANGSGRIFNAYVNIGSLTPERLAALARNNPRSRFIRTSPEAELPIIPSSRQLELYPDGTDKWASLTRFLNLDYPAFMYPDEPDIGQRELSTKGPDPHGRPSRDLRSDVSPWIVQSGNPGWGGLEVETPPSNLESTPIRWTPQSGIDQGVWFLRGDTFPSNLALFTSSNFRIAVPDRAVLELVPEPTPVREFTSAAIACRQPELYGRFRAELRPTNVPGLITGFFLHRNEPRQEIDIEFLGRDTTKLLVNVYYNPGPPGTKLEYGYRGAPTEIDLGFDAAEDFHIYEIEWQPDRIRWRVDGVVVYERFVWNPTPIPDQPLELNLNLWHSRSTELAGRLALDELPATTELRSIEIYKNFMPAALGASPTVGTSVNIPTTTSGRSGRE